MIKNYIANQAKEIEKEFFNLKLKDILCFFDNEKIARIVTLHDTDKVRSIELTSKENIYLFDIVKDEMEGMEDKDHANIYFFENENDCVATRVLTFFNFGKFNLAYYVYKKNICTIRSFHLNCIDLKTAEIMPIDITFHKDGKQYIDFGATSFSVKHYMTADKSKFITLLIPDSKQVFWEGVEYDVKDDGVEKLDDLLNATEEKKKMGEELSSQQEQSKQLAKRKRL